MTKRVDKKLKEIDKFNEKSFKIAIVGCGAITEFFYLPALAKFPSIINNLVLVDLNDLRKKQIAKKFVNVRFENDYNKILKEVDGAIIAVPTHLHYPITMDFLSQGIPVLCEKPLAENAQRAELMIEKAKESEISLAVNHTRRIFPTFSKIKDFIVNNSLGNLLHIQYCEGENFKWPTASGFYFDKKVTSKGVLMDRGAHALDLICWWINGKPDLLLSRNDSLGGTEAVAHVKFEHQNCIGEVKLSLLGKFPCIFRIKFEGGIVEGDIYDFQSLMLIDNSGKKKRLKLNSSMKDFKDFGYKIVNNYIRVIANDAKPIISGSDVIESIRFIDECYTKATQFSMPWYDNWR